MLVAGRLWDRRIALVAGGLAAVSPALVYVNGSLVSEQIFLPLMLGAVLVPCSRARPRAGDCSHWRRSRARCAAWLP